MTETAKIIQALCYILERIGQADKLKLVKLLYLADKRHLIQYGRTITGDEYWAMDYGPVGSATKDVLSFDDTEFSSEAEYAEKMIKKVGRYNFQAVSECSPEELDHLSETDIEAIQHVLERFGNLSKRQLIDYTHRYPEWAQYEPLFKEKQIKRIKIATEEVLSTLPDDPLEMPAEHIDESRRILLGLPE